MELSGTADSSGQLLISGRGDAKSKDQFNNPAPGVFFNAIRISGTVPEEAGAFSPQAT